MTALAMLATLLPGAKLKNTPNFTRSRYLLQQSVNEKSVAAYEVSKA